MKEAIAILTPTNTKEKSAEKVLKMTRQSIVSRQFFPSNDHSALPRTLKRSISLTLLVEL